MTAQPLSGYILKAVCDLATKQLGLDWPSISGHLVNVCGFGQGIVERNKEEILKIYLNSQSKYSQSRVYSQPPISPVSPPQETPIEYTSASPTQNQRIPINARTDDQAETERPRTVQIYIDEDRFDPVACEHRDDIDESAISIEALHKRHINNLIQDNKILLTWRRGRTIQKTYTTMFDVVPAYDMELVDIRFGRKWLEGPPPKKRKGIAGEVYDVDMPLMKRQRDGNLDHDKLAFVAKYNAQFMHEYFQLEHSTGGSVPTKFQQAGVISGVGRLHDMEGGGASDFRGLEDD